MEIVPGRVRASVCTVVLLLIAGTAVGQEASPDASRPRSDTPELVVHGEGRVNATPDRALVSLGAEGQAETAASAQSAVNDVMARAVTNLVNAGIPQKAIKTSSLDLYPVYAAQVPGKESEPPRVVAYHASNTIQVEVRELQRVGKVIDAAMESGINRLGGVSFGLENDLPQRVEALRSAVAAARAKADAMADALGVRINGVERITEGPVNVIQPRAPLAMRGMAAVPATPVEPGEVRVEAAVTVSYRIVPQPRIRNLER